MRCLLQSTLCLTLCMLRLSAAAQSPATTTSNSATERSASSPAYIELGSEIGLTTHHGERSTLWVASPVIDVSYHSTRPLTFSIDWGFIVANESPLHGASQTVFASANAALSVTYALPLPPSDRLDVYMTVAPPLAWLPDSTTRRGLVRGGYAYAAASRGLWDAWLWGPEQLATAGGARWSRTAPHVRYGAQAALAASLPLSAIGPNTIGGFAQLAPFIELHEARGPEAPQFSLGVRLQSVIMSAASDLLQLSVSPYARLDTAPVSLQLRGMLNLDEPSGFLGSGLGIWGLLFSAQGRL
jgi:hypothetical protein